ncbi:MltR family transcriptional regulator [Serratia fonticola]|jgi:DNA-binding MltR family transcriptional regulator
MDARELLCEDEETRGYVSTVFDEIKNEFAGNSDRGITVIAVSIIDALMEDLLESFLVTFKSKTERKNIFSSNGPLSNLSNKIEMAFSLGLLSVFDKKLLNTLVSIRNKFAHQINGISFKNKEVMEKCKQLVICDDLLVSMDMESKVDNRVVIYKPRKDDYRGWFQTATYIAITILASRKTQYFHEKRLTPDDFKHRSDFSQVNIDSEEIFIKFAEDMIINRVKYCLTAENVERANDLLAISKERLELFEKQKEESFNVNLVVKD